MAIDTENYQIVHRKLQIDQWGSVVLVGLRGMNPTFHSILSLSLSEEGAWVLSLVDELKKKEVFADTELWDRICETEKIGLHLKWATEFGL